MKPLTRRRIAASAKALAESAPENCAGVDARPSTEIATIIAAAGHRNDSGLDLNQQLEIWSLQGREELTRRGLTDPEIDALVTQHHDRGFVHIGALLDLIGDAPTLAKYLQDRRAGVVDR